MFRRSRWQRLVFGVFLAGTAAGRAQASVALLMEEPYGEFGAFNPTGHAAVYLNHVCAETPTQLRMCRPGELGVVNQPLSQGKWLRLATSALIPYLYAVDSANQVPATVDKDQVATLRDAYRRAHLMDIAPGIRRMVRRPAASGRSWWVLPMTARSMVSRSTAPLMRMSGLSRWQNDKRNVGHFNIFSFRNCADFSRGAEYLLSARGAPERSRGPGSDDAEAGDEVAGEIWQKASGAG